jgi:hypothetical protein
MSLAADRDGVQPKLANDALRIPILPSAAIAPHHKHLHFHPAIVVGRRGQDHELNKMGISSPQTA